MCGLTNQCMFPILSLNVKCSYSLYDVEIVVQVSVPVIRKVTVSMDTCISHCFIDVVCEVFDEDQMASDFVGGILHSYLPFLMPSRWASWKTSSKYFPSWRSDPCTSQGRVMQEFISSVVLVNVLLCL